IWASGAAEFHHRALSEPDVSLSAHPAPGIRLFAYRSGQCAKSSGLILTMRANHSRALFGFCLKRLNLRRAHFLRWKSIRRRLSCIARFIGEESALGQNSGFLARYRRASE